MLANGVQRRPLRAPCGGAACNVSAGIKLQAGTPRGHAVIGERWRANSRREKNRCHCPIAVGLILRKRARHSCAKAACRFCKRDIGATVDGKTRIIHIIFLIFMAVSIG
jgi:hypothetical protein